MVMVLGENGSVSKGLNTYSAPKDTLRALRVTIIIYTYLLLLSIFHNQREVLDRVHRTASMLVLPPYSLAPEMDTYQLQLTRLASRNIRDVSSLLNDLLQLLT